MKQKPQHPAASGAAKNAGAVSDVTGNAASDPARLGPQPFNLHLFTTACMLTAAAMPMATDPQQREKVTKLVGDMAAQMMRGLDAYRVSPIRAQRTAYPVRWQDGTTRLLDASHGAAKDAPHILLVPSLINRYDILDLDAQHSFVAHLRDAGFAPFILDWDAPGESEKSFTIDDYITRRLHPALSHLKTPHVIGYCMGGTMAAGAAAALTDQSNIRSLTLLAAPWDFHAGDKMARFRMQAFAVSATPVMAAQGVLPVDWIQALFASVDPLFAFNKFRAFADMDPTGEDARRFVIVEDWLNDGVDLAAPAAHQAITQWYVANEPANGVWTIGTQLVDPARIAVPTLVVAAGNDRLVPAPSALALMQQMVAADTLTPGIGHIGMMASTRAKALVWDPVTAWLAKH